MVFTTLVKDKEAAEGENATALNSTQLEELQNITDVIIAGLTAFCAGTGCDENATATAALKDLTVGS